MEEKKKKTEKKSLSKQIRELRLRNKELKEANWGYWTKFHKLNDEIELLRKLTPLKIYRIKYKIMANDKITPLNPYEEIIQSYNVESAINEPKKDKTYPKTFKLVDIQLLGE
jgi:hypothetical protein